MDLLLFRLVTVLSNHLVELMRTRYPLVYPCYQTYWLENLKKKTVFFFDLYMQIKKVFNEQRMHYTGTSYVCKPTTTLNINDNFFFPPEEQEEFCSCEIPCKLMKGSF